MSVTLATELPAIIAIVIDQRQSRGPTRRMYNLAIHRFLCWPCRQMVPSERKQYLIQKAQKLIGIVCTCVVLVMSRSTEHDG